jgi:branched-chain amino acid transport system permease protein
MTKKRLLLSLIPLAAACAVPFVFDPEKSYVVYFLFMASLYVTLAQSWNLVAGYTGQVSLGHHAFFGVGGYVVAILWSRHLIGYLDPIGMVLAGVAASLLALLVGIPLLSKLRGDYFALGTLGLGEIMRLLTIQLGAFTGGPMGILLPSSSFGTIVPHYFIALLLAVIAIAATFYMVKSRIGLALVSIREDEAAAEASGINVLTFKVLSFAVAAFLAGVAGAILAYYIFTVEPQGFYSLNWTLYPVLMCVLGGAGTMTGPIIGGLLLTAVFEVARYFLPEIHPIFSGLFIILAIMFLPTGIMGLRKGALRKGGVGAFDIRRSLKRTDGG